MDEVTFNFPENIDAQDKASYLLQFLVNRAAVFDKEKYEYMYLSSIGETDCDYVLYHVLSIISIIEQVPLYIPKYIPWQNDLSFFTYPVGALKMLWLKMKKKGITFSRNTLDKDVDSGKNPQIFQGFRQKTITEIAENLYDYRGKYGY